MKKVSYIVVNKHTKKDSAENFLRNMKELEVDLGYQTDSVQLVREIRGHCCDRRHEHSKGKL